MIKKCITIQDISCYGKCSITVALPVISSMGIETIILPTAVLSTHTSGFNNFTYHDLTNEFDKIKNHWKEYDLKFDSIYTGDLGQVGSEILEEMLKEKNTEHGTKLASLHKDCGLLLYDREIQDVHSGASGCGCSASVLASTLLPKITRGELKKILFLSTGALMSTSSVSQGDHILGVAPVIQIEYEK